MNEAITIRDPEPLPLARVADSPMDLMRLAVEKGADVGSIERLAALAETFDRKRAKREFDDAMAAFQAECPTVLKSINGAQNKYKFASMDHILQITRPLLVKHGFSWCVTNPVRDGWVKCVITVKHSGGHSEQSDFEVPIDTTKTRDGSSIMSAPQQYGSARTFCMRYAFTGAFGILTANEDRDGQSARSKVPSWLADKAEAAAKVDLRPAAAAKPEASPTKAKLWKACQPIRGGASSWDEAERWMRSKKIIQPGIKVSEMTDAEMAAALDKVEIELSNV